MNSSGSLYFVCLIAAAALLGLWLTPAYAGHGGEEIDYISPQRVKALLDGGEKVLFIDLRSPKEFREKRIPGARSIPVAELEKRLHEIPKAGRVILYCACRPGDDAYAFFLLRDNEHRNVVVLEEGFPAWLRRKYHTEANRR
jgi:rhodanese-related sulfurtransferase